MKSKRWRIAGINFDHFHMGDLLRCAAKYPRAEIVGISDEKPERMEEAIRKIPEIVSCHYISGAGTFELQVVSRDLDTFSQFARKVLINLPNVKDLHTSFSLGEVKASSSLPLSHLGTRTP